MAGGLKSFCLKFSLDGISQVYFWKSEWETFNPDDLYCTQISWAYLAYRFIYALFFWVASLENYLCDPDLYFIYLTNLAFTIQLIYATYYFLVLLIVKLIRPRLSFKDSSENELLLQRQRAALISGGKTETDKGGQFSLPVAYKVTWVLTNIVNTVPYGVSALFWLFLYTGESSRPCENVFNYFLHASNSLVALLDGLVVAVPIRYAHVVFPLLTTSAYVLFSILYEIFGGSYKDGRTAIYPILNWNESPGVAAISGIGGVLSCFLMHGVFCWGVAKFRAFVVRKYFS